VGRVTPGRHVPNARFDARPARLFDERLDALGVEAETSDMHDMHDALRIVGVSRVRSSARSITLPACAFHLNVGAPFRLRDAAIVIERGEAIVLARTERIERVANEPFEIVSAALFGAIPERLHLRAADLARGSLSALATRNTHVFPMDSYVRRALEQMRARLSHRWTIAELSRLVGLSRAPLTRRFVAALGAPPLRHLAELRMRAAADRLRESDETLAEIAARVGYRSEFAFAKAFKRLFGVAPGVFRKGNALQTTMRAAA
jgi:AraC-like DNA-binding protein